MDLTNQSELVVPHTEREAPWETTASGNLATPCFRCLFEEAPPPGMSPTCDTVGVLGSAVAIVANFQAAETLKILTGNFDRVSRTLLSLDLWANEIQQLKVADAYATGDCPCCRHRRFDYLEGKAGSSATALCGRDAVQLRHRQQAGRIDLQALASRLEAYGEVMLNEYLLRARLRDGERPYEITLFPDGRAIVKGTGEPAIARSIYAKYVGT